MSGLVSTMRGLTKMGTSSFSGCPYQFSFSLWCLNFAMGGFLSTISANDIAIGESLSTISGSVSTMSES